MELRTDTSAVKDCNTSDRQTNPNHDSEACSKQAMGQAIGKQA